MRRPYARHLHAGPQRRDGQVARRRGAGEGRAGRSGQPGTPADKAGVKPGDVIVTVDGKSVDGSKAVQKSVLGHNIGQKIDLGVWRDGKELKLTATTAEALDDGGQLAQNGGGAAARRRPSWASGCSR